MHLGILSGLIVALTAPFWSGTSAQATGAVYQTNINNTAALYSILAQTATTPTIPVTGTVQAASTITATSVVTGSGSITATATLTNASPTVPPPTPITLPTSSTSSGGLQINPFDWSFLTGTPTSGVASSDVPILGKLGPFSIIFLILMLALIGAAIYFYRVRAPQWKSTNTVLFKAVNRFAPAALWIGVLGILFIIFRVIPLDFFNLRFWLYLDFLLLVALAIWMVYWYRTSYPKEMEKYLKTQKARQYMPGGSGRIPSRSTPVVTPSAKGNQQPKAGGAPKPSPTQPRPPQQGNKNRKKK